METTTQNLFELKIQVNDAQWYMPRVYDVNMPCQWLKHCYGGKCPALRKIKGNMYCARKRNQW